MALISPVLSGSVKVCEYPGSCVLTPDCEKFSFSFGACETSADVLEFCQGGVSKRRGEISYGSAKSSCDEGELTLACYTNNNCTGTVVETEFPKDCDADTMTFFTFTCSSNSGAASLSNSFIATFSFSAVLFTVASLF